MPTLTLVGAIRDGLRAEMLVNDKVLVFGEDVGKAGGVFLATDGLQAEFGEQRVFDTPLAEAGILGLAIGLALEGFRAAPEIQFVDFIYPGFDQVVSEIAKFRYRSGGEFPLPLTIRAPYGGGIRGGHYHSQSPEAYFCHTPGLKVVIPSTPYDAKGLLISALRDPDPVIFLEPKKLYRSIKGEVPADAYTVPLGLANVVHPGDAATVVAWGTMLQVSLAAAQALDAAGHAVEVVDLRTLVPFDGAAVLASVRKTGRLVVVQEAPRIAGFGAEIAAFVAEEAIDFLKAPVARVAGFDTPYPYALDDLYLPDPARVEQAVRRVLAY